jgi:hypothetical protein
MPLATPGLTSGSGASGAEAEVAGAEKVGVGGVGAAEVAEGGAALEVGAGAFWIRLDEAVPHRGDAAPVAALRECVVQALVGIEIRGLLAALSSLAGSSSVPWKPLVRTATRRASRSRLGRRSAA